MNFFAASSILASLAFHAAFAGPFDDFTLGDDNEIVYDQEANIFTLTFNDGTTSTNNEFGYNFFAFDCVTDKGNGEADGFKDPYFGNQLGNTPPTMTFELDMSTVKNSDTFTDGGAESKVEFCLRNTVSTSDGAIEVDFRESAITLTMNLTADVATDTVVEKKAVNQETEAEQVYAVITTLCDNTPNPLRQGDLITVCMEPNSTDVVIASLVDFAWTQRGGTGVIQEAVDPADTSANPLTTDPNCDAVLPTQGQTCQFSSVLRADFYIVPNIVDGEGTANFALNRRRRRRRLNARNSNSNTTHEAEGRLLQQGLDSDVSILVPIVSEDSGPGALRKTAGGASFGISVVASGVVTLLLSVITLLVQ